MENKEIQKIKKYEISEKQLNDTLNVLQITLNTFMGSLMSLKEIKEEDKKEK